MNNTVENDYFYLSRYTGYIWQARWTICKIFVLNFLRISHAKNHWNGIILDRVIQKMKGGRFLGHGVCFQRPLLSPFVKALRCVMYFRFFLDDSCLHVMVRHRWCEKGACSKWLTRGSTDSIGRELGLYSTVAAPWTRSDLYMCECLVIIVE